MLKYKSNLDTFIYLLTDKTYTSVYQKYKSQFSIEFGQIIFYDSFVKLWHNLVSHIKFQPLEAKLTVTRNKLEQYNNINNQYKEHHV